MKCVWCKGGFQKLLLGWIMLIAYLPLQADTSGMFSGNYNYRQIHQDALFFPPSHNLSADNAAAISAAVISVYLSATATSYQMLLADSMQTNTPVQDKVLTNYLVSPVSGDTLLQIDLRIYSPRLVGRRYNRMLIIRPYDEVVRPCILYTHGNQGNLQSWVTYYAMGVADMLQRGYAVAFYENWNSFQHVSLINAGDLLYKKWEKENLEDNLILGSDDKTLQRAHYLLYQYAYAAAAFVNAVAKEYRLDRSKIFTAGHSAGGLASLMLTFAKPGINFQHPIFAKVGTEADKCYPGISVDGLDIRGVFSSGAGLPDGRVTGTFTGTFFDMSDANKVAVMIHGKRDPAAAVDYGPGLWANFVDTMKLMGPLSLKPLMDENRIKNYTIINCLGEHGVHLYPGTAQDRGGRFVRLLPMSYSYEELTDERFEKDTTLQQLLRYQQQLVQMFQVGAAVFAEVIEERILSVPSGIYSWQTSNYTIPMVPDGLSWRYMPAECGIRGAKAAYFPIPEGQPTSSKSSSLEFKLYPTPANAFLKMSISGNEMADLKISIHDASGRQMYQRQIVGDQFIISTAAWPSGMYFFTAHSEEGRLAGTQKFLIAR
jgi:pimeloyl-ACP methyl ester carboxylesterase